MRPANSIRLLARVALLLGITLAIQGLRLPTPVTGPLVNLMLILSTALVGAAGGVVIGLLTPWAALFLGILPRPWPRRCRLLWPEMPYTAFCLAC